MLMKSLPPLELILKARYEQNINQITIKLLNNRCACIVACGDFFLARFHTRLVSHKGRTVSFNTRPADSGLFLDQTKHKKCSKRSEKQQQRFAKPMSVHKVETHNFLFSLRVVDAESTLL